MRFRERAPFLADASQLNSLGLLYDSSLDCTLRLHTAPHRYSSTKRLTKLTLSQSLLNVFVNGFFPTVYEATVFENHVKDMGRCLFNSKTCTVYSLGCARLQWLIKCRLSCHCGTLYVAAALQCT